MERISLRSRVRVGLAPPELGLIRIKMITGGRTVAPLGGIIGDWVQFLLEVERGAKNVAV
jgi:hypothetical protein